MAYDLKRFSAGTMNKGVDIQQMQFLNEVLLDEDSFNMTTGIQVGSGPRYGVSSIPGQTDNQALTGTRLPGLRSAEENSVTGLANRRKVLGWVQLSLPDPSDATKKVTCYAAVITSLTGGLDYLDILICSTINTTESISQQIYDGFGVGSAYLLGTGTVDNSFLTEGIVTAAGVKTVTLPAYLKFDQSLYYASIATINVTGPLIQTANLLGQATANGDATHAPSVSFFAVDMIVPGSGVTHTTMPGGIPSEYQLLNFKNAQRSIQIVGIKGDGSYNIGYSLLVTPSTTTFKQDLLESGNVNLDVSAITATKTSSGTTYANSNLALVTDEACTTDSSFSSVAVAGGKPYMGVFQGPWRCSNGRFNQWFDLTQNVWQPPIVASNYTEAGNAKSTSFAQWPDYIPGEIMPSYSDPQRPKLLGADTGVLRKGTAYELTYSIYNKRLNFESNVGVPVKFNTGPTNDFVGLQIWYGNADETTPYTQFFAWGNLEYPASVKIHTLPYHFAKFQDNQTSWYGNNLAVNFGEYRFYYRQLGTFEWLPAGNIDAAQFWFDGYLRLNLCTGPVAATPGGQPGGFNDYSPLPTDNYTCVVQYKNRFFWFSDKACVFSLSNNVFAYPARNSISASTGQFLGGIVHNYPGQAEQSSRLVMFGTDTTYVARFTGVRQQTTVQVSADSSGVYDVDGSDLVIDPWTSATAFSYRSAVVADGLLYWWGPQGIYRDDGVNTPTKISGPLEPNIFEFYDHSKQNEINAVYNPKTKEITWFYPPKTVVDTNYTQTIVWNVENAIFQFGEMPFKVDWAQGLNLQSTAGTSGNRTAIGARATSATTKQRSYFYDERNRAGDMYPTTELIVKSVEESLPTRRRLNLATGYDATNLATVQIGDLLAIQQFKQYTGSSTGSDMIASILAVNTDTGYIDIALPTGGVLPGITPTYGNYFPVWQAGAASRGLNGINYQIKTNYWAPAGINGYFFWYYCYLLAKVNLWTTDLAIGPALGYRTPTASGTVTDQLTLVDNNDGNWQLYHPLNPGNDNAEGQAIRFILSGVHIGHEWVLQYLEAHVKPIDGDPLKRFEG